MQQTVLYIHGKGGGAGESEHYRPLFPGCGVIGLDYRGNTPWEAGREIRDAVEILKSRGDSVILIANSIGAFFTLHAQVDALVEKAYFISPIVDMEGLIRGMMTAAQVTEAELEARGTIPTPFGEDLSCEYLRYIREHPVRWRAPTWVLYGGDDVMTSLETVTEFARRHKAALTVMENGEHWFHTKEQMRFLDDWIKSTL